MVRTQSQKRKLATLAVIGIISVIFFSYFFLRPTTENKTVAPAGQVVSTKQLSTWKFTNKASETTSDPFNSDLVIYTSYRLGIRFTFPKNLYNNGMLVQESGNIINFSGYSLLVFNKNSNQSLSDSITKARTMVGENTPCKVEEQNQSEDGVIKAVLITDQYCESSFLKGSNGGHFFMYPKDSDIFFFTNGRAGTPALFDHRGTWIDTLLIKE